MSVVPGQRLGPYEIVAKLGEGGMGVVYRAKDSQLGREVALKVLPESLEQDPERLARFEREAKVLAQLNHPNIAQIYGLESQGGTRALVMELVDGPTLAERLEDGPLPLAESFSVALQIAQALEEAHEKGIVHRDLKPQNVKASVEGRVKVLDFGLAKAFDPAGGAAGGAVSASQLAQSPTLTAGTTALGIILGTAAYMSPEQARGRVVDKRADVWAFGVVLWEMLSGERLFAADSVVDTLSAVLQKPIPLERLPAATPARVRELLRRCLERDPRRRLRDIGEARVVLEEGGTAPEPVTSSSPAARALQRRAGLGALAAVAVVAALAGAFAGRRLAAPEPIEPIRLRALTFSGRDADPTASPDGRLVAFTSWRDGVSRIWIKQIVGGGEAPLTSGPDRLARFAPDGSGILFLRDLGATHAVYRVGLVGGEPRRLVEDVIEADWSPDGRRIVFVRSERVPEARSILGVFELDGGRETVLAEVAGREVISARWSPDGSTIAFTTGFRNRNAATWRFWTVEVASRRMREVPPAESTSAIGGLAWSGRGRELFFIQSGTILGDIAGSGSWLVRCDPRTGERRRVLWGDGLASLNASVGEVSRGDVLAPGALVYGQRLRRQNLREVELAGPEPGRERILSEGSSIDRQPAYSPDGRLILFSSNRGGNLDLWTLERATGALRQLTDDPAQDWDPGFSADGRRILWSSDRSGHLEIWTANADGSGARRVSDDGVDAENPTETPDGSWIVYWSGNSEKAGLWRVRPDGSEASRIRPANAVNTELSPDGRTVLYVDQDRVQYRNTVRFVDLASGAELPFRIEVPYRIGSSSVIFGRARWARGGRSIYYVGEDERRRSGVFVQDFAPDRDTSATRRPVAGFSAEYVTESLGLSPDGRHLTISTGQESASILVAEGVPGALPPDRSAR